MDRDHASIYSEPDASAVTQDEAIVVVRPGVSARDALLIVTSWAALASFVVYPELQLIAFGATISGVAILNRAASGA